MLGLTMLKWLMSWIALALLAMLLAAMLVSLGACSTRPVAPTVVPCPKPQISPQLLLPAERVAGERLIHSLPISPPPSENASATPTGSTH